MKDKSSIVISEKAALSLFNTTENIIGKMIEVQHERQYLVSGIFKNITARSSTQFDFLLSVEVLKETRPQVFAWENSGPNTFLVTKPGTDVKALNDKIAGLIKTKTKDTHRSLFLIKYADNYLYNPVAYGVTNGGRIEYVIMFSTVGVFILIIACINFMNLATAKATRRIKEVGIKKAVGAGRGTLILQYLMESLTISFISLLVAFLLADFILPQFNVITGKHLTLDFSIELVTTLLCITLFTGLLAGSYPALYLSGASPAVVLRGPLNSSLSELWARKGLVVFQFALSFIFIVAFIVIYKQIQYLQTENLGYEKENVIYFEREGRSKENLDTFLDEVKKIPGVINASSVGQSMVGGGNTTGIEWEGKDPNVFTSFAYRPVNLGVIEMLDLKLREGRTFKDRSDTLKVIFNKAGIETMGLRDPIGKTIKLGPYEYEIVGIVDNFHYESLHVNVGPLFFIFVPAFTEKVIAKIEAGKETETLNELRKFYHKFNPGFVFEYRFLDQDYQAQYDSELRVGSLSKYFSVLAIVISCLGLFGLAAFTAERRLKEIGIRKVLGSTEFGIVYLLSADFTKMVFAAVVIGLPISYFLLRNWLNKFAFKIELEWWYFISAAFVALFIAWFTVGLQTIKAARVNPAKCLRDE